MTHKVKTHKGAKKRFFLNGKGNQIHYRHSNRAHINTKMSMKSKRNLRKNGLINQGKEFNRINKAIS
jgi:ribosomal protein L35